MLSPQLNRLAAALFVLVAGSAPAQGAPAPKLDKALVWGEGLLSALNGDNIVWGMVSRADNIVWGELSDDNIVWGMDDDNIVWGMDLAGGLR